MGQWDIWPVSDVNKLSNTHDVLFNQWFHCTYILVAIINNQPPQVATQLEVAVTWLLHPQMIDPSVQHHLKTLNLATLKVCMSLDCWVSNCLIIQSSSWSSACSEICDAGFFLQRRIIQCSFRQSHSGWLQHCLLWKGLLPSLSHRLIKLVSLVPRWPLSNTAYNTWSFTRKKIWVEKHWIKQVFVVFD